MHESRDENSSAAVVDFPHLQHLITVLRDRGYTVVGPMERDGAIVYDELATAGDLPIGWTDEQDGGTYRLRKRDDDAAFGYAVGPHSWKRFLFPPVQHLWQASLQDGEISVPPDETPAPRYAFIGVRSCELHAIAIQDRVFMGGQYVDPVYRARREQLFIVAVNCMTAGGTCFCVSMGTGPEATAGYDLAMTEILGRADHYFVVQAGSEAGASVLADLPRRAATADDRERARQVVAETAAHMGRSMETEGIRDLLVLNAEHPRWQDVADRCLSCGNCTMACPTCFCTNVEDVTDLTGTQAVRQRSWDSCFTMSFSYIHGGSVRRSTRSRYRQWMTHKLSTWWDQFGTSGCVGCGRCITWCPVGIDITAEVAAIRAGGAASRSEEVVNAG
jgi:formate hydrogenlyase subunit 6/NADH:ubiquinone oxidoreductase subunit I